MFEGLEYVALWLTKIHCEKFLKKLIVSSSIHLEKFCYGHYSVLSRDTVLSQSFVTSWKLGDWQSSTKSLPELVLSWREHLNARHASTLGQPTSYVWFRQGYKGSGLCFNSRELWRIIHKAIQGLYYNYTAAHLSFCPILCPGSLWIVPECSPQTSCIQISIFPEFTSLGTQPVILLGPIFLVDTMCLCLCTIMGWIMSPCTPLPVQLKS